MKLTSEQIKIVQLAVVAFVQKARARYAKDFPMPVVKFDLRGTVAGKADYRNNYVLVNQTLCSENFDHYIKQTIGHEVAHLIAHALYPGYRIKPHGNEWQGVMRGFGLAADRCHAYDVSNARARTVAKHKFSCNCKVHEIGDKVARNIMVYKKEYHCKLCKGILKAGEYIGSSPKFTSPKKQTTNYNLPNYKIMLGLTN